MSNWKRMEGCRVDRLKLEKPCRTTNGLLDEFDSTLEILYNKTTSPAFGIELQIKQHLLGKAAFILQNLDYSMIVVDDFGEVRNQWMCQVLRQYLFYNDIHLVISALRVLRYLLSLPGILKSINALSIFDVISYKINVASNLFCIQVIKFMNRFHEVYLRAINPLLGSISPLSPLSPISPLSPMYSMPPMSPLSPISSPLNSPLSPFSSHIHPSSLSSANPVYPLPFISTLRWLVETAAHPEVKEFAALCLAQGFAIEPTAYSFAGCLSTLFDALVETRSPSISRLLTTTIIQSLSTVASRKYGTAHRYYNNEEPSKDLRGGECSGDKCVSSSNKVRDSDSVWQSQIQFLVGALTDSANTQGSSTSPFNILVDPLQWNIGGINPFEKSKNPRNGKGGRDEKRKDEKGGDSSRNVDWSKSNERTMEKRGEERKKSDLKKGDKGDWEGKESPKNGEGKGELRSEKGKALTGQGKDSPSSDTEKKEGADLQACIKSITVNLTKTKRISQFISKSNFILAANSRAFCAQQALDYLMRSWSGFFMMANSPLGLTSLVKTVKHSPSIVAEYHTLSLLEILLADLLAVVKSYPNTVRETANAQETFAGAAMDLIGGKITWYEEEGASRKESCSGRVDDSSEYHGKRRKSFWSHVMREAERCGTIEEERREGLGDDDRGEDRWESITGEIEVLSKVVTRREVSDSELENIGGLAPPSRKDSIRGKKAIEQALNEFSGISYVDTGIRHKSLGGEYDEGVGKDTSTSPLNILSHISPLPPFASQIRQKHSKVFQYDDYLIVRAPNETANVLHGRSFIKTVVRTLLRLGLHELLNEKYGIGDTPKGSGEMGERAENLEHPQFPVRDNDPMEELLYLPILLANECRVIRRSFASIVNEDYRFHQDVLFFSKIVGREEPEYRLLFIALDDNYSPAYLNFPFPSSTPSPTLIHIENLILSITRKQSPLSVKSFIAMKAQTILSLLLSLVRLILTMKENLKLSKSIISSLTTPQSTPNAHIKDTLKFRSHLKNPFTTRQILADNLLSQEDAALAVRNLYWRDGGLLTALSFAASNFLRTFEDSFPSSKLSEVHVPSLYQSPLQNFTNKELLLLLRTTKTLTAPTAVSSPLDWHWSLIMALLIGPLRNLDAVITGCNSKMLKEVIVIFIRRVYKSISLKRQSPLLNTPWCVSSLPIISAGNLLLKILMHSELGGGELMLNIRKEGEEKKEDKKDDGRLVKIIVLSEFISALKIMLNGIEGDDEDHNHTSSAREDSSCSVSSRSTRKSPQAEGFPVGIDRNNCGRSLLQMLGDSDVLGWEAVGMYVRALSSCPRELLVEVDFYSTVAAMFSYPAMDYASILFIRNLDISLEEHRRLVQVAVNVGSPSLRCVAVNFIMLELVDYCLFPEDLKNLQERTFPIKLSTKYVRKSQRGAHPKHEEALDDIIEIKEQAEYTGRDGMSSDSITPKSPLDGLPTMGSRSSIKKEKIPVPIWQWGVSLLISLVFSANCSQLGSLWPHVLMDVSESEGVPEAFRVIHTGSSCNSEVSPNSPVGLKDEKSGQSYAPSSASPSLHSHRDASKTTPSLLSAKIRVRNHPSAVVPHIFLPVSTANSRISTPTPPYRKYPTTHSPVPAPSRHETSNISKAFSCFTKPDPRSTGSKNGQRNAPSSISSLSSPLTPSPLLPQSPNLFLPLDSVVEVRTKKEDKESFVRSMAVRVLELLCKRAGPTLVDYFVGKFSEEIDNVNIQKITGLEAPWYLPNQWSCSFRRSLLCSDAGVRFLQKYGECILSRELAQCLLPHNSQRELSRRNESLFSLMSTPMANTLVVSKPLVQSQMVPYLRIPSVNILYKTILSESYDREEALEAFMQSHDYASSAYKNIRKGSSSKGDRHGKADSTRAFCFNNNHNGGNGVLSGCGGCPGGKNGEGPDEVDGEAVSTSLFSCSPTSKAGGTDRSSKHFLKYINCAQEKTPPRKPVAVVTSGIPMSNVCLTMDVFTNPSLVLSYYNLVATATGAGEGKEDREKFDKPFGEEGESLASAYGDWKYTPVNLYNNEFTNAVSISTNTADSNPSSNNKRKKFFSLLPWRLLLRIKDLNDPTQDHDRSVAVSLELANRNVMGADSANHISRTFAWLVSSGSFRIPLPMNCELNVTLFMGSHPVFPDGRIGLPHEEPYFTKFQLVAQKCPPNTVNMSASVDEKLNDDLSIGKRLERGRTNSSLHSLKTSASSMELFGLDVDSFQIVFGNTIKRNWQNERFYFFDLLAIRCGMEFIYEETANVGSVWQDSLLRCLGRTLSGLDLIRGSGWVEKMIDLLRVEGGTDSGVLRAELLHCCQIGCSPLGVDFLVDHGVLRELVKCYAANENFPVRGMILETMDNLFPSKKCLLAKKEYDWEALVEGSILVTDEKQDKKNDSLGVENGRKERMEVIKEEVKREEGRPLDARREAEIKGGDKWRFQGQQNIKPVSKMLYDEVFDAVLQDVVVDSNAIQKFRQQLLFLDDRDVKMNNPLQYECLKLKNSITKIATLAFDLIKFFDPVINTNEMFLATSSISGASRKPTGFSGDKRSGDAEECKFDLGRDHHSTVESCAQHPFVRLTKRKKGQGEPLADSQSAIMQLFEEKMKIYEVYKRQTADETRCENSLSNCIAMRRCAINGVSDYVAERSCSTNTIKTISEFLSLAKKVFQLDVRRSMRDKKGREKEERGERSERSESYAKTLDCSSSAGNDEIFDDFACQMDCINSLRTFDNFATPQENRVNMEFLELLEMKKQEKKKRGLSEADYDKEAIKEDDKKKSEKNKGREKDDKAELMKGDIYFDETYSLGGDTSKDSQQEDDNLSQAMRQASPETEEDVFFDDFDCEREDEVSSTLIPETVRRGHSQRSVRDSCMLLSANVRSEEEGETSGDTNKKRGRKLSEMFSSVCVDKEDNHSKQTPHRMISSPLLVPSLHPSLHSLSSSSLSQSPSPSTSHMSSISSLSPLSPFGGNFDGLARAHNTISHLKMVRNRKKHPSCPEVGEESLNGTPLIQVAPNRQTHSLISYCSIKDNGSSNNLALHFASSIQKKPEGPAKRPEPIPEFCYDVSSSRDRSRSISSDDTANEESKYIQESKTSSARRGRKSSSSQDREFTKNQYIDEDTDSDEEFTNWKQKQTGGIPSYPQPLSAAYSRVTRLTASDFAGPSHRLMSDDSIPDAVNLSARGNLAREERVSAQGHHTSLSDRNQGDERRLMGSRNVPGAPVSAGAAVDSSRTSPHQLNDRYNVISRSGREEGTDISLRRGRMNEKFNDVLRVSARDEEAGLFARVGRNRPLDEKGDYLYGAIRGQDGMRNIVHTSARDHLTQSSSTEPEQARDGRRDLSLSDPRDNTGSRHLGLHRADSRPRRIVSAPYQPFAESATIAISDSAMASETKSAFEDSQVDEKRRAYMREMHDRMVRKDLEEKRGDRVLEGKKSDERSRKNSSNSSGGKVSLQSVSDFLASVEGEPPHNFLPASSLRNRVESRSDAQDLYSSYDRLPIHDLNETKPRSLSHSLEMQKLVDSPQFPPVQEKKKSDGELFDKLRSRKSPSLYFAMSPIPPMSPSSPISPLSPPLSRVSEHCEHCQIQKHQIVVALRILCQNYDEQNPFFQYTQVHTKILKLVSYLANSYYASDSISLILKFFREDITLFSSCELVRRIIIFFFTSKIYSYGRAILNSLLTSFFDDGDKMYFFDAVKKVFPFFPLLRPSVVVIKFLMRMLSNYAKSMRALFLKDVIANLTSPSSPKENKTPPTDWRESQ